MSDVGLRRSKQMQNKISHFRLSSLVAILEQVIYFKRSDYDSSSVKEFQVLGFLQYHSARVCLKTLNAISHFENLI